MTKTNQAAMLDLSTSEAGEGGLASVSNFNMIIRNNVVISEVRSA